MIPMVRYLRFVARLGIVRPHKYLLLLTACRLRPSCHPTHTPPHIQSYHQDPQYASLIPLVSSSSSYSDHVLTLTEHLCRIYIVVVLLEHGIFSAADV